MVSQAHTLGIAKDRNPARRSRDSAGSQGNTLCPCPPMPCPAPWHSRGAEAAAVPPLQVLAPSAQPEPVIDVPAEVEEQILPRREQWELPRPLGGTRPRGSFPARPRHRAAAPAPAAPSPAQEHPQAPLSHPTAPAAPHSPFPHPSEWPGRPRTRSTAPHPAPRCPHPLRSSSRIHCIQPSHGHSPEPRAEPQGELEAVVLQGKRRRSEDCPVQGAGTPLCPEGLGPGCCPSLT